MKNIQYYSTVEINYVEKRTGYYHVAQILFMLHTAIFKLTQLAQRTFISFGNNRLITDALCDVAYGCAMYDSRFTCTPER